MVLEMLAEYRKKAGLTQEQLAFKTGMTGRTINRIESGKGVHLNNAKAIAKALHVKLDELTRRTLEE